METKVYAGKFGRLPVYGAVTDINSADASTLISASTRLVKTVATVAAIGAGVGLGAVLLKCLLDSSKETVAGSPPIIPDEGTSLLPMAYTPLKVKSGNREFWGILLDDSLKFTVGGGEMDVPFDYVQNIRSDKPRGRFEGCWDRHVELVDGSLYRNVEIKHGNLTFAAIGGNQMVDVSTVCEETSIWSLLGMGLTHRAYYVGFATPTVSDVEKLRARLMQILTANRRQLVEQIGADNLKAYFSLDLG